MNAERPAASSLEVENQRLREALAPFVAATATTDVWPEEGGRDFTLRVTGLNIRRARAALAGKDLDADA